MQCWIHACNHLMYYSELYNLLVLNIFTQSLEDINFKCKCDYQFFVLRQILFLSRGVPVVRACVSASCVLQLYLQLGGLAGV